MLKGISIFIVLIGLGLITPAGVSAQAENNPPVVRILAPSDKSTHERNSQLRFQIKVSDPEDGESEYDEIATHEVFLEVRYLADVSKVSTYTHSPDPNGLQAMKKSNCFNCHAFNSKLIAPSLLDISKRYPENSVNTELLAKRIREGSVGVWGGAAMPTHAEISDQEARDIVTWIFKNAQDPDLNYYTGTEGSIRINAPGGTSQKRVVLLSASYSDHGSKNNPVLRMSSKDVILLYVK